MQAISKMFNRIMCYTSNKGFIIPLLFQFLVFWFLVFEIHPSASSEPGIDRIRPERQTNTTREKSSKCYSEQITNSGALKKSRCGSFSVAIFLLRFPSIFSLCNTWHISCAPLPQYGRRNCEIMIMISLRAIALFSGSCSGEFSWL